MISRNDGRRGGVCGQAPCGWLRFGDRRRAGRRGCASAHPRRGGKGALKRSLRLARAGWIQDRRRGADLPKRREGRVMGVLSVGCFRSGAVMVAAGHDLKRVPGHTVHKPMLAVDPAGPQACKITLQRRWLARALKRVAQAFLDQAIDLAERRLVGVLPVPEMLPCSGFKDQLHSLAMSSSSSIVLMMPCPASSSAMDCISARRLAGDARR